MKNTPEYIMHIDCNNFYVSCERAFHPELNGRPVVALSNNDACVISRSEEAKALGIPMAVPVYQYEEVFKKHDVVLISSNFPLYLDMSRRVIEVFRNFTDKVEVYSVDESFLSAYGMRWNLEDYAREIKEAVMEKVGIPVSIGIAETKTLAKLATRIAKKFPKQTHHIHWINTDEKRIKALKWVKVEDIWGVGRGNARKLARKNIKTGYDFSQMNPEWVKKNMSVNGLRMLEELNNISCIEFSRDEVKKSITVSRSFKEECKLYEELRERLATYTFAAAQSLREQKSMCSIIEVFVETSRFRNKEHFYARSRLIKLPFPTSSTIELTHFAEMALKSIFRESFAYKRAGIILADFIQEQEMQLSLFENSNPKHRKLMQTIDALNQKKPNSVRLCSMGDYRDKMKEQNKYYSTKNENLVEPGVHENPFKYKSVFISRPLM